MPQSAFFDRNFDVGCVPPPESHVVSQRAVELGVNGVLLVPVLELPRDRGSAICIEPLHSALVVPHLLSERTLAYNALSHDCALWQP